MRSCPFGPRANTRSIFACPQRDLPSIESWLIRNVPVPARQVLQPVGDVHMVTLVAILRVENQELPGILRHCRSQQQKRQRSSMKIAKRVLNMRVSPIKVKSI